MAHESFEDADVAARDERRTSSTSRSTARSGPTSTRSTRPAHALLTRRSGGWPLTMFLTPDGAPFFGGTYFPKHGALRTARLSRPAAARGRRVPRAGRRRSPSRAARLKDALASCEPAARGATRCRGAALRVALAELMRAASTRCTAASARAPKFPHRDRARALPARGTRATAMPTRSRSCASRSSGWPTAASTTSWAAASAATASTPSGRSRISRRCSTTTDRCSALRRPARAVTGEARSRRSRAASSAG